jgi:hypothetical protein
MKALRLPTSRIRGRLFLSLPQSVRSPSFVSRRSAPGRSEVSSRPGSLLVPATLAPAPYAWTRMGSLRSSGDPSRASAAFHDPGRIDVSSPLTATSMLPHGWDCEGFGIGDFEANTQLQHLLPYASRATLPSPMQGLLPAGWLAFTGRESNPLDRYERFQFVERSSSFPALLTLPIFIGRGTPVSSKTYAN